MTEARSDRRRTAPREAVDAAALAVAAYYHADDGPETEVAKVALKAAYPLIAARVLREAADAIYGDGGPGHPLSTATWLRERADALTTILPSDAGAERAARVRAEERAEERQRIAGQVTAMCTYRTRAGLRVPGPHGDDVHGHCPYGVIAEAIIAAGSPVPVATPAEPVDLGFLSVGESVHEDPAVASPIDPGRSRYAPPCVCPGPEIRSPGCPVHAGAAEQDGQR